jgi:hypothetical protein
VDAPWLGFSSYSASILEGSQLITTHAHIIKHQYKDRLSIL